MENKKEIVTKLIKVALKNKFRFGNLVKAPGFRYYNFEVFGGDVFGYGIELTYTKSVPTGSEHTTFNIDFTSLLLSKKFMTKLLKHFDLDYISTVIYRAYEGGINDAVDYLDDLLLN